MGKVLKFDEENRAFVRFFSDYVDCDWCSQPTRGRVYEESQSIICSVCRQPLLEISEEDSFVVVFDGDNSVIEFDGDEDG